MATTFAPIAPAPVRDYRSFDFTREIAPTPLAPPASDMAAGGYTALPGGVIVEALWSCRVMAGSQRDDPEADRRLVTSPVFDAMTTSQLVGDCVEGVTYELSAQVTLSDGRVFVKSAPLICYGAAAQDAAPPVLLENGAIPFDYESWVLKFPEFQMLTETQAQAYWDEAGLLFRNDATSPVPDPTQRREILDLLTAHCAALFAPPPMGRGGSAGYGALAGVITSKSVNGVSVGSSGLLPGFTGNKAWFAQTQYGLKYLSLTAGWRQFHYVPGPYPRFPPSHWPAYGYAPAYWPRRYM